MIKQKNVEELVGLDMVLELGNEDYGRHNVFLNFSKI